MIPVEFLQRFCSSDDKDRPYLSLPELKHDGFVYASNGHIAIRLKPDDLIGELPDRGDLKPIPDAVRGFFKPSPLSDGNYYSLNVQMPDKQECQHCAGNGEVLDIEALYEDGVYSLAVDSEDWENDKYWLECGNCHGTGQGFSQNRGVIGEMVMSLYYLSIVAVVFPFGECWVNLPRMPYSEDVGAALSDWRLLFEGGNSVEVVLMPHYESKEDFAQVKDDLLVLPLGEVMDAQGGAA